MEVIEGYLRRVEGVLDEFERALGIVCERLYADSSKRATGGVYQKVRVSVWRTFGIQSLPKS